MNGPVRAFRNTSKDNYITVVVPDTVAALGTRVRVETENGESYTRDVLAGQGMLTDQTPELTFGLGKLDHVLSVTVNRPNGETEVILAPPVNQKLSIR